MRGIALAIALGFLLAAAVAAGKYNSSFSSALDVQASQKTSSVTLDTLSAQLHVLSSQQASVFAELGKLSAQQNDTSMVLGNFYSQQVSVNGFFLNAFHALYAQLNDTNVALDNFYSQQVSVNGFFVNAFNALQTSTNASLTELGSKQDAFNATLTGLATQQAYTNAALANLTSTIASHSSAAAANFSELLASSFTLSSAANVRSCARSSVFFIEHTHVVCSAFAYRSGPVGAHGTILVSAAHCFLDGAGQPLNLSGGVTAQTLATPPVNCSLLAIFGRPSDTALLHCPGAAGIPPLRRRANAAAFFLPAATAGFAADELVSSEYSLPLRRMALNIRLSYVGTTLGAGRPAHPTSSHGTDSFGYRVAGVVEQGTVGGMSGGPVVDASCGVLGVNHVSLLSSGFAGLDEVDQRMSEMFELTGEAAT